MILIDIILAGDNAIVIVLVARNVPERQRKREVLIGTAGVVIVLVISTLLILKLLEIPDLMPIGGVLLVWVGYNLLTDEGGHEIMEKNTLISAVRTIVIGRCIDGD